MQAALQLRAFIRRVNGLTGSSSNWCGDPNLRLTELGFH